MRRIVPLFVLAPFILVGCAADPPPRVEQPAPSSAVAAPAEAPPGYDEFASRYNERTADLTRIWSRAAVQMEYIDTEGDRRKEQGEGHLQLVQPGRIALDVGKLGEVLLWLGCDADRYWLFEPRESRASVGRHENIGKSCNRSLGLPAHPLDILDLMGVTPLPASSAIRAAGRRTGWTQWTRSGEYVVVEAPARFGRRRMFVDPKTLLPRRIELHAGDAAAGAAPELYAELTEPEEVRLRSRSGFFPRVASRVEIRHPESETEITLFLDDMSDGEIGRGRISDVAFDFESLRDAFAPSEMVVLDAPCATPAVSASAPGAAGGAQR